MTEVSDVAAKPEEVKVDSETKEEKKVEEEKPDEKEAAEVTEKSETEKESVPEVSRRFPNYNCHEKILVRENIREYSDGG